MTVPYFFGYGSLVNVNTHAYGSIRRATAKGWRRAWRHTALRDIAFLTAVPDETSEILGLIASVPNGDWAALDDREFAYERVSITPQVSWDSNDNFDVSIYAIAPDNQNSPSTAHPILLSYLDVVVQGYFREFGTDGVHHFGETTDGWDAPILDDRAAPRYPRAQSLTGYETQLVDDLIATVGARLIDT